MSLSRAIREQIRERELHKDIKEENANIINQRLYLRGIEPQTKKRYDKQSKKYSSVRNLGK